MADAAAIRAQFERTVLDCCGDKPAEREVAGRQLEQAMRTDRDWVIAAVFEVANSSRSDPARAQLFTSALELLRRISHFGTGDAAPFLGLTELTRDQSLSIAQLRLVLNAVAELPSCFADMKSITPFVEALVDEIKHHAHEASERRALLFSYLSRLDWVIPEIVRRVPEIHILLIDLVKALLTGTLPNMAPLTADDDRDVCASAYRWMLAPKDKATFKPTAQAIVPTLLEHAKSSKEALMSFNGLLGNQDSDLTKPYVPKILAAALDVAESAACTWVVRDHGISTVASCLENFPGMLAKMPPTFAQRMLDCCAVHIREHAAAKFLECTTNLDVGDVEVNHASACNAMDMLTKAFLDKEACAKMLRKAIKKYAADRKDWRNRLVACLIFLYAAEGCRDELDEANDMPGIFAGLLADEHALVQLFAYRTFSEANAPALAMVMDRLIDGHRRQMTHPTALVQHNACEVFAVLLGVIGDTLDSIERQAEREAAEDSEDDVVDDDAPTFDMFAKAAMTNAKTQVAAVADELVNALLGAPLHSPHNSVCLSAVNCVKKLVQFGVEEATFRKVNEVLFALADSDGGVARLERSESAKLQFVDLNGTVLDKPRVDDPDAVHFGTELRANVVAALGMAQLAVGPAVARPECEKVVQFLFRIVGSGLSYGDLVMRAVIEAWKPLQLILGDDLAAHIPKLMPLLLSIAVSVPGGPVPIETLTPEQQKDSRTVHSEIVEDGIPRTFATAPEDVTLADVVEVAAAHILQLHEAKSEAVRRALVPFMPEVGRALCSGLENWENTKLPAALPKIMVERLDGFYTQAELIRFAVTIISAFMNFLANSDGLEESCFVVQSLNCVVRRVTDDATWRDSFPIHEAFNTVQAVMNDQMQLCMHSLRLAEALEKMGGNEHAAMAMLQEEAGGDGDDDDDAPPEGYDMDTEGAPAADLMRQIDVAVSQGGNLIGELIRLHQNPMLAGASLTYIGHPGWQKMIIEKKCEYAFAACLAPLWGTCDLDHAMFPDDQLRGLGATVNDTLEIGLRYIADEAYNNAHTTFSMFEVWLRGRIAARDKSPGPDSKLTHVDAARVAEGYRLAVMYLGSTHTREAKTGRGIATNAASLVLRITGDAEVRAMVPSVDVEAAYTAVAGHLPPKGDIEEARDINARLVRRLQDDGDVLNTQVSGAVRRRVVAGLRKGKHLTDEQREALDALSKRERE